MKKLSIIALLIAVMLYSFSSYITYVYECMIIRQSMHQAIRSESYHCADVVFFTVLLQHLTPDEQTAWLEDEVGHNGEMYDVISRKMEGSKLILRCICDKNETEAVADFIKNMQDTHRIPAKKAESPLKIFLPLFDAAPAYSYHKTEESISGYPAETAVFLQSRFQHVPTPPPWLV